MDEPRTDRGPRAPGTSTPTPLRVVFLDAATMTRSLAFDSSAAIDYHAWDATEPDEVAERIAGADAVITNKVRLTAAHLTGAARLRLIAIAAAGTDNVDLEAAAALGIAVHNVPDYGSDSVAEHAIALLFALRRALPEYAAAARDGRWSRSPHFCWVGPRIRDLGGSRFGIVGRGRIGEAVGRIGRGLGMLVTFAQTPGSPCRADELPLGTLLAESDAVTLHLPLTPETRGLIAAHALGLMRPDAVLINTGRGGVVDATALADALRRGDIAGAAIDVLESEPPNPAHPLLADDIPNLIVTPHVAWSSESAQARLAERLCGIIRMLATGRQDTPEFGGGPSGPSS